MTLLTIRLVIHAALAFRGTAALALFASALGSIAKSDDAAAVKALESVSEGKQKNKALKKAAGDALRRINGGEK